MDTCKLLVWKKLVRNQDLPLAVSFMNSLSPYLAFSSCIDLNRGDNCCMGKTICKHLKKMLFHKLMSQKISRIFSSPLIKWVKRYVFFSPLQTIMRENLYVKSTTRNKLPSKTKENDSIEKKIHNEIYKTVH